MVNVFRHYRVILMRSILLSLCFLTYACVAQTNLPGPIRALPNAAHTVANGDCSYNATQTNTACWTADVSLSSNKNVVVSNSGYTFDNNVVVPSFHVTGMAGFGTRCVQVDNTGAFSVFSAGCGGGGGSGAPFSDASPIMFNSGDATKLLSFALGGFTTGTTRTLTPQNANYTLAGIDISNSFTQDQTYTTNIFASGGSSTINVGSSSSTGAGLHLLASTKALDIEDTGPTNRAFLAPGVFYFRDLGTTLDFVREEVIGSGAGSYGQITTTTYGSPSTPDNIINQAGISGNHLIDRSLSGTQKCVSADINGKLVMLNGSECVTLAGTQTITGSKTFNFVPALNMGGNITMNSRGVGNIGSPGLEANLIYAEEFASLTHYPTNTTDTCFLYINGFQCSYGGVATFVVNPVAGDTTVGTLLAKNLISGTTTSVCALSSGVLTLSGCPGGSGSITELHVTSCGNLTLTNTATDIPSCTLTLNQTGTWMITGNVTWFDNFATGGAYFQLLVNGSTQGGVGRLTNNTFSGGVITTTTTQQWVVSGSSGNVVKLQAGSATSASDGVVGADTKFSAIFLHP